MIWSSLRFVLTTYSECVVNFLYLIARDTANLPFCKSQRKDVNSDWFVDQWDERSVLGHARINKGRLKGDDPEIDPAQTPKRFDRRLALQEKIRKTFTDSIPSNINI